MTVQGFHIGALRAPWDSGTVQALNALQRSGKRHGYTCAEHPTLFLEAREDGWHCPNCDYHQNWVDQTAVQAGMQIVKEQWHDAVATMLKGGLLKDTQEKL